MDRGRKAGCVWGGARVCKEAIEERSVKTERLWRRSIIAESEERQ